MTKPASISAIGGDIIRRLPQTMSIAWALAARESRSRYAGSLIDYFWIILAPTLYAIVFVILRQQMSRMGIEVETAGVHPVLFAFTGVLLWQTWFETFLKQIDFIKSGSSFLKSQPMPPEVFFISRVMLSLVDLSVRFVLIVLAMLIFQQAPGPYFWAAPLAALALLATANLLGLYFAVPGSFFPDVIKAFQSVSLGLFLISPIFYAVPNEPNSILFIINHFHPFGAAITTFRDCLYGGGFILLKAEMVWLLLLFAPAPLVLIFYRQATPLIVERI